MDENHKPTLVEAQFEWAWRLVQILQPLVYDGVHAIFNESVQLCVDTDEPEKYLMTFQNFLARIPKWNDSMVTNEVQRIVDKSGCSYLEDLITCVHIVHLKILTSIRTGKTQKKIDVIVPKLNEFVHKVYILVSRQLYTNVYLFEKDVTPIAFQKNRAGINKVIKNSILDAIRDSIPVERLLRAYLDESTDLVKETKEEVKEVKEEVKEEVKAEEPVKVEVVEEVKVPKADPVLDIIEVDVPKSISFNDKDRALSTTGNEEIIEAPKTIDRLEKISEERNKARKAEDDGSITISDAVITDLPIEVIA
jgi:Family of unknown function (DUF5764)